MPVLIAILLAVGGAIWLHVRSNPRGAAHIAGDLVTAARNAPRRPAFRRQTEAHPVEGIDDPAIAVAGIARASIELDDLPTRDPRDGPRVVLRSKLRLDEEEAAEAEVLARWPQERRGGAKAAVPRLARRPRQIDGDASRDLPTKIPGDPTGAALTGSPLPAVERLRVACRRPVQR